MKNSVLMSITGWLLCMSFSQAQAVSMPGKDVKIRSAMSSAPPSITANATIKDWPAEDGDDMPILREGSNGWTCFPDMPATAGNDPMCLDKPWLAWADAWMNKKPLKNQRIGFRLYVAAKWCGQ